MKVAEGIRVTHTEPLTLVDAATTEHPGVSEGLRDDTLCATTHRRYETVLTHFMGHTIILEALRKTDPPRARELARCALRLAGRLNDTGYADLIARAERVAHSPDN